jgi:hypothetical protein
MATENEPSRQETEARFVRSDDPQLSAEANAALTEETRRAVGADRVRMAAGSADPASRSRAGGSAAKATAVALRPVFIITLLAGLTTGAIVSLATGSWWALIAAAAVHAIGTIVVASGAIQLTTETEHASPQTTALLEGEGVADPDRVLSDLVEEYTGTAASSPTGGVVSAGETASTAPAAERRALTPGYPASGESSAVAALPWLVVTGVVLTALIAAIVDGGKMWVAPAIMVPLGAMWIVLDRYLASRNEQERSLGPGRLVAVGASIVAGVILFLSMMRLVTEWGS